MIETVSGGGVILGPDNRIVVVNQHGNSWSLPKGHVDPGEDVLSAAVRETKEEAGITELKLIKELGNYQRPRIGKNGGEDLEERKSIHIFLFTTEQTELKPIDPDNPEARWVTPDDVAELLTHPKDSAFFTSVLPEIKKFIENR